MTTKLLAYLLEPETVVVFDIDGVLAAYEFGERGHSPCEDADWETYVREHDPYAHIRPIRLLQRFIEEKGRERVYACSCAQPFDAPGKRAFCQREYGLDPSHVRLVEKKGEKAAYLRELSTSLNVPEERVALVEDTTSTLYQVNDAGAFTTVHVSSFFAYDE